MPRLQASQRPTKNKVKWEIKHHDFHVFNPPSILVFHPQTCLQDHLYLGWSDSSLKHMTLLQFRSQPASRQAWDKHGHYSLCPCCDTYWEVCTLHLWKGFRTFFLLLGGFPLSPHVSLDSGRWLPGMKKPVWPGGGENGGAPALGGWWGGGPEGKKPPLADMSFGGAPLKMRLKKSCRSAGLVGPGDGSEGGLFRVGLLLFLEPKEMW